MSDDEPWHPMIQYLFVLFFKKILNFNFESDRSNAVTRQRSTLLDYANFVYTKGSRERCYGWKAKSALKRKSEL